MTDGTSTQDVILAIDQGTSSSRAMLFDRNGVVRAQAQQELACDYPQSGWVEQDAEALWLSILTVCREVLAQADSLQLKVCGIGITNQRETTLLWRRDSGDVVAPAIVWQDRRTLQYCQMLQQRGHQAWVSSRTGLCLDPYFSASKLNWLLQEPALRLAAEQGELAFGTVDSFILWRLTRGRVHATDTTNASRTLLFGIQQLQWDAELLELFDIPAQILPQVRQSADDYGRTDAHWFGRELPIVALAGDQQAAAIGQGCVRAGGLKSTYGTGCFALLNTGEHLLQSKHQLLSTVACTVQGQTQYALEGSIFVAGAAVKWLRDQLGLIKDAAETETLAASLTDNGGVYLVPAFTGLGAPYWRPELKAQWSGLTLGTGKAQLARAVLEAVAYQTADLLQAMRADGAALLSLQVDGGMVNNSWFCQFLANVLDINVMRPLQTETTAFGVALLAGIQLGWYADLDALPELVRAESWFYPNLSAGQRAELLAGWQRAVAQLLATENP
ncbi:glycerol kinase GlpK [Rheinheimera sp. F8]|uniref:glycerol kinase GlpK n=1 Tax=Rheinheimera sp. F8 TaxID=1763998 RepID=UPI000B28185D|nr:glycerol kinase GlpK [Rheinheimera sp. F8]